MSHALPDPFPDDPFFRRGPDPEWNACIGVQGDEQNYVDGYIQAANELVAALIDKDMSGKRDTLVLPILYNARHAVELVLKFCASRLHEAGLINAPAVRDHRIELLWKTLDAADLGDRTLRKALEALKPYIDSLAAIDQDGQELRYHRNTSDDASLAKYSIANLEVIRASLAQMEDIIGTLQSRTLQFVRERRTGTFTKRCSRRDLYDIAERLPPRSRWREPDFDQAKAEIRADYGLSNCEFSRALVKMQEQRELRGILGLETGLSHLDDDLAVAALTEWRNWHPTRPTTRDPLLGSRSSERDAMAEDDNIVPRVIAAIRTTLTADQYAELTAMFFLARDRTSVEYYPDEVRAALNRYTIEDDPTHDIVYVMGKMNFLRDVTRGAKMVGRLELSRRLAAL